ncbi:C40 family peptidase [Mariniflexile sp. HNIBRBA6329]|uniref:C40 family peptidase n=1 Tax=Mariniflexile sp. HNIBRBA6329 TaxID=3373088 RepID=UPI0037468FF1
MLLKKISVLLLVGFCLGNCKSSKGIVVKKQNATKQPQVVISSNETIKSNDFDITPEKENAFNSSNKAYNIVDYAKQFKGVKYKFGGATRDGMDCSGLVFESFRAFGVILPRISRDMAKQGDKISLKNIQEGDLLFFKTMNRRNDISHVGLVVTSENGDIEFIHSTTSLGVITSRLSEKYWDSAFVEARRIL